MPRCCALEIPECLVQGRGAERNTPGDASRVGSQKKGEIKNSQWVFSDPEKTGRKTNESESKCSVEGNMKQHDRIPLILTRNEAKEGKQCTKVCCRELQEREKRS